MKLASYLRTIYEACKNPSWGQIDFFRKLLEAAKITKTYSDQTIYKFFQDNGVGFSKSLKLSILQEDNIKSLSGFFNKYMIKDCQSSLVKTLCIDRPSQIDRNALAYTLAIMFKEFSNLDKEDDIEPYIATKAYRDYLSQNTICHKTDQPHYPNDNFEIAPAKSFKTRYHILCYEDVVHKWIIKNTGTIEWKDRKLEYNRKKFDRAEANPSVIIIPDLSPGQSAELETVFNGRGFETVTDSQWRIIDKNGNDCFPKRETYIHISTTFKKFRAEQLYKIENRI